MKKVGYGLLIMVVLLAFAVGIWQGGRGFRERPLAIALTTEFPQKNYDLQGFNITLADRLTITHDDGPARLLWQSVSGSGFVGAGIGHETVTESRGSFKISDDLELRCTEQTIESEGLEENIYVIKGHLGCDDGSAVPYQFSLTVVENRQLQFHIEVDDPRINRTFLTYSSHADEHIYGFGEQFSYFDLKGRRLPIFVMEQGVGRGLQPITAGADLTAGSGGDWHTSYAGVPHYMTSDLRSLFLETSPYSVFDMRQDDRIQIQLFSSEMTGRILYGDTPSDLIQEYTSYAGRMRRIPSWALHGAIIGMQGGNEKVLGVLEELNALNTPIAAFWLQDWVGQRTTSFGKQLWWNWELDQNHYPNWDGMLETMKEQDIRVMIYLNPFLADASEKKPKVERNLYQEAIDADYLVKTPEGEPYLIQNTSFSAGLLDLTNPEAWDWMVRIIQDELVDSGASGWMADFGEALPYDAVLYSGVDAAEYHNLYAEEWARLNREAIDALPNGDELLFFSRAGYTQSPEYSTLFWLGDQMVTWDAQDGMKTAVIGLLSSGLSGYAFNHSDIGGYTTITHPIQDYHRDKELLLRWMELNAFTTIYRTHEGNIPDVNHQFYSDEETMAHFAYMAKVYQAWEPYRLQLVQEASETGLPVVRHPFVEYWDDPNVLDLSYQQFMVGTEFMVAPVLDPETTEVEIYLPQGYWVHLWSGEEKESQGEWFTVPAPLGEPAVFYLRGSAIGSTFAETVREIRR